MSSYHCNVSTVKRSQGRSSTAAAAYRAGEKIKDERTGEIFDYSRKGGVESSEIILPDDAPDWAKDRAALWNAAEAAEKRKDSQVAREYLIALPAELSPDERKRLAFDFAREIVERHGVAADVAIHAPGRGGDDRNHHAHILTTTRRMEAEGLTAKTVELDRKQTSAALVTEWRERWADLQNERLQEAGSEARVHSGTLEAQGITDREPGIKMGPAATAIERRGEVSEKRLNHNAAVAERRDRPEVAERLQSAKQSGEFERELAESDQRIIDLSGDLRAAKRAQAQGWARERERRPDYDQWAAHRARAAKAAQERSEKKENTTTTSRGEQMSKTNEPEREEIERAARNEEREMREHLKINREVEATKQAAAQQEAERKRQEAEREKLERREAAEKREDVARAEQAERDKQGSEPQTPEERHQRDQAVTHDPRFEGDIRPETETGEEQEIELKPKTPAEVLQEHRERQEQEQEAEEDKSKGYDFDPF